MVLAVYINFTSLLNSVDDVGSVGAWIRGWRETNFGIGRMFRVGPQRFCADQKKMAGVEILEWVKHMIV